MRIRYKTSTSLPLYDILPQETHKQNQFFLFELKFLISSSQPSVHLSLWQFMSIFLFANFLQSELAFWQSALLFLQMVLLFLQLEQNMCPALSETALNTSPGCPSVQLLPANCCPDQYSCYCRQNFLEPK